MCTIALCSKAHQLLILLSSLLAVDSQKLYLPPSPPSFGLPEVVDVRARVPSSLPQDSNYQPPPLGLQLPYPSDAYPTFGFKSSHSESFRDVLTNELTIKEMSCQNNGDDLYFRASLLPLKSFGEPVIEQAGGGSCKISKQRSEYRIEFGKDEFWNCGVIDCSAEAGKFYCLSLRFPTISGLRLRDDFKVTLQCRAQENIVSHTRRINLKTIDTAARMAPRLAAGGHKNAFETELGLYRQTFGSEHVFDGKIESGGAVVLGEEILIRAAVREGDGWKYSKMSEVTVQFLEKRERKRVMNSLWILDSEGCLNPRVRDICPGEQYRVAPLESYLLFKAFMFQNMQETDEMVLSVKVTGCHNGDDCVVNCHGGHARKARDLRAHTSRNGTFDWQDDITFRVLQSMDKIKQPRAQRKLLPFVLVLLALALVGMAIFVIKLFTRRRSYFKSYT